MTQTEEEIREEVKYGLNSHFDIGTCPDCLTKEFGPDWPLRWRNPGRGKGEPDCGPRDMHGNMYCEPNTTEWDSPIVCHVCQKVLCKGEWIANETYQFIKKHVVKFIDLYNK